MPLCLYRFEGVRSPGSNVGRADIARSCYRQRREKKEHSSFQQVAQNGGMQKMSICGTLSLFTFHQPTPARLCSGCPYPRPSRFRLKSVARNDSAMRKRLQHCKKVPWDAKCSKRRETKMRQYAGLTPFIEH